MQPEIWLAATLPLKSTASGKLQQEESKVIKLLILNVGLLTNLNYQV